MVSCLLRYRLKCSQCSPLWKWAWTLENARSLGLLPFPARAMEMTSIGLVKMRKAAISNVQHFHPYGGRPSRDIAGRPGAKRCRAVGTGTAVLESRAWNRDEATPSYFRSGGSVAQRNCFEQLGIGSKNGRHFENTPRRQPGEHVDPRGSNPVDGNSDDGGLQ